MRIARRDAWFLLLLSSGLLALVSLGIHSKGLEFFIERPRKIPMSIAALAAIALWLYAALALIRRKPVSTQPMNEQPPPSPNDERWLE
jgi:hypothetical protein